MGVKCGTHTGFTDPVTGKMCKKAAYGQIAGLSCSSHANEEYADKSRGKTSNGSTYNYYIVGGISYSADSYTYDNNGKVSTKYRVPFPVLSAHLPEGELKEQARVKYEGQSPTAKAHARQRARDRGNPDAPPVMVFQRQESCGGIRAKCIEPGCEEHAYYEITGLRCPQHVVDTYGEWDPIDNVWWLHIPGTDYRGMAFLSHGNIVIGDFVFLVYDTDGVGKEVGGARYKKLEESFTSRRAKKQGYNTKRTERQREKRCADADGKSQPPASPEFLKKNVVPNDLSIFKEWDEKTDVCNSSKGRVGGTDGRLQYNEEFRNLIQKCSCPTFLVPEEEGDEDGITTRMGRSLEMKDFLSGFLKGLWEMNYCQPCTEREALDVELGDHEVMHHLKGRMFVNKGGGQRFGFLGGQFAVGRFRGIGWIDMVREGKLAISSDIVKHDLQRYLTNFGLNRKDHVVKPNFTSHLTRRKWMKKRNAECKARKEWAEEYDEYECLVADYLARVEEEEEEDTAKDSEEEDEDRKMPAAKEDDALLCGEDESSIDIPQDEDALVETNRTPKSFLLAGNKYESTEEESDDISPAGIAKPFSSDTAATFHSSVDTPCQLKAPPEKKLTSNMLKSVTASKSTSVDNLKPDGDNSDAEDASVGDAVAAAEDEEANGDDDNDEDNGEEEVPPPAEKKQKTLFSFFGKKS